MKQGAPSSGSKGLLAALRILFGTFGIPEEISSDGGPEYISDMFKDFIKKWGISHRKSSAHHPQSNGRAEVCVKSVKRLLRTNTAPDGSLNTDAVMRGLLQLRNTPDHDTNLSPAEILLGRTLRDFLPLPPRMTIFDESSPVREEWKLMWCQREEALKKRMGAMVDRINAKAHSLEPLKVGDSVHIQNQHGSHPTRWDKTGVITQVGQHDQYMVRVHGSRRLTARNRRFLKKFLPLGEKMMEQHPGPLIKMPRPENSAPSVPISTPPDVTESAPSHEIAPPLPAEPIEMPKEAPTPLPSAVVPEPVMMEPTLRRSTRTKTKPDYYGNWVNK